MSPDRKLTIGEQQFPITGVTLDLRTSGDVAWIEIDEPWAGDTETGIGRSASFTLTRQQARDLAAALAALAALRRARRARPATLPLPHRRSARLRDPG